MICPCGDQEPAETVSQRRRRLAAIARYDFLFLSALAVQILLIWSGLETLKEAKVILTYHVIGTAMEIFKTSVGSWAYPEPAFFRIAGAPLFSGFMYACVGSYLFRVWRLFDFQFTRHPSLPALAMLSAAIYVNFLTHHYVWDARWILFAAAAALFGPARIHFLVWRTRRSMPLLLGLILVATFIWFAEQIGTFTRVWIYPNQIHGWSFVGVGKLGSWFLLLLISYTLVAAVYRPNGRRADPSFAKGEVRRSASSKRHE